MTTMLLRSSLNATNGSLATPYPENAVDHCASRRPVAAMHRGHCKFVLLNTTAVGNTDDSASCSSSLGFRRVGRNSERSVRQVQVGAQLKLLSPGPHGSSCGLFSSHKTPKHQKEGETQVCNEMLGKKKRDEDIDMLMAADSFNWEANGSMMIDLRAKPVNANTGNDSGNQRVCFGAGTDGHGSCSDKIVHSKFKGDCFDMEEYHVKIIGEDPRNPLLLRNYGQFLYRSKQDLKGAEKCYLFAISLDRGNGRLLAEYASLAWELYHDEDMTGDYLKRALEESPGDSFVSQAYENFIYKVYGE